MFKSAEAETEGSRRERGVAHINLKEGAVSLKGPPVRVSGLREVGFKELIEERFERGMLQTLYYPWASGVFLVP